MASDDQKQEEQTPATEQQENQAADNNSQSSPQQEGAVAPPGPQQTQTQAPAPSAGPPAQAQTQQPRPGVHKVDFEQDVVYLFQFARCGTSPSVSPFCLKVETWLRVAGIKYENVDHRMKHWSKKGQLPFVELNGVEIADSEIIVRELSKHFDKDLDSGLTVSQRSVSHAFAAMLDHHTGWVYRWWRYNRPGDFLKSSKVSLQHMRNSKIPTPLLNIFFKLKMKGKKKAAIAHGIGVHTANEITEFGKADLNALNELLGDGPYFFGEEPTLLDVVAFAHLVQITTMVELEHPMKTYLETECGRLAALVERIKERYWPDWEEMCKTLDLNSHLPKKVEEPKAEEKEGKEAAVDKAAEKGGNGGGEHDDNLKDKESAVEEPEKLEKDEKEKEKDKEVDDGDNKNKEAVEEKSDSQNKI